jgi:hypothetical protein
MVHRVHIPPGAGSREDARALLSGVPLDLSGQSVRLDSADLRFATPSLFDEVVKVVLVERRAERLELIDASPRAQNQIERAARNRVVGDRLDVVVPA